MAATNLVARDEEHAATMVSFALGMQREAGQVRGQLAGGGWRRLCAAGCHSRPPPPLPNPPTHRTNTGT
jgi:hypothetical protein